MPSEHTPDTELVAPFTQGNFTYAIVVVIDSQSGELTYSTEPKTIKDVYDASRGSEPVTQVTIPPRAFPAQSLYMVGIAGTSHSVREDVLSGMNTLLSSGMAGKMQFFPVSTVQIPDTDPPQ